MEFPFDINQLFSERISVLDQNLVGGRRSAGRPDLQNHIASVIDELGRASAKAQQLSAPVTSASRLQTQKHQLYLLKDAQSCSGRGIMVGFLKVGLKKLFLLDRSGVHVEAEPLCVLDFYVSEKLQRHGYGLELFHFMLKHKNVEPAAMAYDRPSPKFLAFLARHYFLTENVPQVNNFVVFEGFFLNRTAAQLRKTPQKKPDGDIKPYSLVEREAVRQDRRTLPWPFAPPDSPRRSGSSQGPQSLSVGSSPSRTPARVAPPSSPGGRRDQSVQSPLVERCRAKRSSHPGLAARSNLYSRHMSSDVLGQMNRRFPGVSPLAYTDRLTSTHTAQISSQPPSQTEARQTPGKASQTSAESRPEAGGQRSLATGSRQLSGWSWMGGDSCSAPQRRRQGQEHRSTRPW